VHFKPAKDIFNIEREISDKIQNCTNVSFLTLGKAPATNEYQDCKHVILAGVLQYSIPQNEAVGRSAQRLTTEEELSEQDHQSIRLGKIAHNIFQASCRGYVRKSVDDACPPDCHLYIIFSTHKATGIPQTLPTDIFPGAAIQTWSPIPRVTGKKQRELAAYLIQSHKDGNTTINKKDMTDRLSLRDVHSLDRLLNDSNVVEVVKADGIDYQHDQKTIALTGGQIVRLPRGHAANLVMVSR
jgi:hypothetical protein